MNESIVDIETVKDLIVDLIDTCNVSMGAGLAAPQIGVNKKVVVIKPSSFGKENTDPAEYNKDYMVLVNPKIEPQGELIKWKESCLSIPGLNAAVERQEVALVSYTSEKGENKRFIAEWPFSGGLQHECDHLEGKLFIHRMNKRKAAFLLGDLRRKQRKQKLKAKRALRASRR